VLNTLRICAKSHVRSTNKWFSFAAPTPRALIIGSGKGAAKLLTAKLSTAGMPCNELKEQALWNSRTTIKLDKGARAARLMDWNGTSVVAFRRES
jgi:hypothetical protein